MQFAMREPTSCVVARLEALAMGGAMPMRVTKSGTRGVCLECVELHRRAGRLAGTFDLVILFRSIGRILGKGRRRTINKFTQRNNPLQSASWSAVNQQERKCRTQAHEHD
uniref:Uncharacterized protein n=2 Tax=Oryza TaxID=4527 RepID=A0A0E0PI16_ORYRU